jgi:hypothetical protein
MNQMGELYLLLAGSVRVEPRKNVAADRTFAYCLLLLPTSVFAVRTVPADIVAIAHTSAIY